MSPLTLSSVSTLVRTQLKGTMRKLASRFSVFALALLISACSMSKEEIGETTKTSMQQKFDLDPQFRKWHLIVTNVQVLKQGDNRYQGIATIVHEGGAHEMPVDITADGSNVMWQVQPGAFMFVAQRELQKLLSVPTDSSDAPPKINALLAAEEHSNSRCQGGSGDDPKTLDSCRERDHIFTQLKANGWCYGKDGEYEYQKRWRKCE